MLSRFAHPGRPIAGGQRWSLGLAEGEGAAGQTSGGLCRVVIQLFLRRNFLALVARPGFLVAAEGWEAASRWD